MSLFIAFSLSSVIEHRRRHEAAELALDQLSQLKRRAVLEKGANDLHADRQAGRRKPGRDRGRGKAGQCRDAGPGELVEIGIVLAIDRYAARFLLSSFARPRAAAAAAAAFRLEVRRSACGHIDAAVEGRHAQRAADVGSEREPPGVRARS
jgi:hypothetical protein